MEAKSVIAIAAVIIVAAGIYKFSKCKTIEGFLGDLPSFQPKAELVGSATTGAYKGAFFSVPGTFQSILEPRFSNTNYGATIKYNMPAQRNQAVPTNPLAYSAGSPLQNQPMISSKSKECYGSSPNPSPYTVPNSYPAAPQNTIKTSSIAGVGDATDTYGVPCCGRGGNSVKVGGGAPLTEPGYAAGNFNQITEQQYQNSSSSSMPVARDALLPLGEESVTNALGDTVNPVMYQRLIPANRNSYLRSRGDMIRGDLAIPPNNTGWFQVSVTPSIDLQQGAMNVMGGIQNETANDLAKLIYADSAGSTSKIAGVDMGNQLRSTLGAGMSDLNVTAFP